MPSSADLTVPPTCSGPRPRTTDDPKHPARILPNSSSRNSLVLVARRKGSLKSREALLERYPLGLLFGDLRAQLLLERRALSLVFGNLRTQLLNFVQQHRNQLV